MAKRISSSAANWAFITENLSKSDIQKIMPVKLQSEKFMREIASRPAELPKIDWNSYKAKVGVPGMVDTFQKNYEALKIPYPSDQGELSKTEASNKSMMENAQKKFNELVERIEKYKKALAAAEAAMKYSEMTMEEFYLARPDLKIDPEKPKLWPQHYTDASEREASKGH